MQFAAVYFVSPVDCYSGPWMTTWMSSSPRDTYPSPPSLCDESHWALPFGCSEVRVCAASSSSSARSTSSRGTRRLGDCSHTCASGDWGSHNAGEVVFVKPGWLLFPGSGAFSSSVHHRLLSGRWSTSNLNHNESLMILHLTKGKPEFTPQAT